MNKRGWQGTMLGLGALAVAGCNDAETEGSGGQAAIATAASTGITQASTANGFESQASAGSGAGNTCAESSKVVYLVTTNRELVAFDPTIPGTAAYHLVGTMDCIPLNFSDLSIVVLDDGTAIVMAERGKSYRVELATGACQPTGFPELVPNLGENEFEPIGLTSTAVSDGAEEEIVYLSAARLGFGTYSVTDGSFTELTPPYDATTWIDLAGGADGKLFALDFSTWELDEISRADYASTLVYQHAVDQPTGSGGVARYGGKFYIFRETSLDRSTFEYDPQTGTETLRDMENGYFVVGAGQSRCVPPPVPS